jgi:hypothetical protein
LLVDLSRLAVDGGVDYCVHLYKRKASRERKIIFELREFTLYDSFLEHNYHISKKYLYLVPAKAIPYYENMDIFRMNILQGKCAI